MLALAAALVLANASFPLPTVDGKAPAVSSQQKRFRLPMGYARARAFYDEAFKGDAQVKLKATTVDGRRRLAIVNTRKGDTWARAVVTEGDGETVIDVTPVMRLAEEQIEGNGRPLVQFFLGRSKDVGRALESIDHTGPLRN